MALILKKSVFIHVAKTGGTWVSELLRQQGLVSQETKRPHTSLRESISEIPFIHGLPSFAFVRHPVTWWKSYWSFRMKAGWDPNHTVDSVCRSDQFDVFIRNMLDRRPGYLSRRYREMTQGVTYIGRFEALRESLMEILHEIGEQVPEALYEKVDANVAGNDPAYERRCRLDPDLLADLIRSEGYAFRHFGYGLENRSMAPPVIWITGLPSSGKTALAEALAARLRQDGRRAEVLDGDQLRQTMSRDLDFSEAGRREQARRTAHMAAVLARNMILPIVALVSPYKAHRQEAREIAAPMIEVYVRCPLSVCEARNTKGLYREARAGLISGVTGLDAPYQIPESPEVTVDSDNSTVEHEVENVMKAIFEQGRLL